MNAAALAIGLIFTFCTLVGVVAAWIRHGSGANWGDVVRAGAQAFVAAALLIVGAVAAWAAVAPEASGSSRTCYPIVASPTDARCSVIEPSPIGTVEP